MIKLVALDLDETLLMEDKSIPDEAVEALQKAAAKGVQVVIATGRIFPSARKYAQRLGTDSPVVCYNGSMIRTSDGGILAAEYLAPDDIRAIAAFCRENDLYLQAYDQDNVVIERRTEMSALDFDTTLTGVQELGDFEKAELHPTPKMIILAPPERLKVIWPEIEKIHPEKIEISQSQSFVMEVMPRGVSKAKILAKYAEMCGIRRDEVMACGDNVNDIEMIRWAGTGVSVANGVPEAKAAADYVTTRERSFGVVEAVEKFILNA